MASLTLRKNESSDTLIEGKDLGNIVLPLMLLKPRLAAAVKTVARDMSMFISTSDADWVLREIDGLLADAHAVAAYGSYRSREPASDDGENAEDTPPGRQSQHGIISAPFYYRAAVRMGQGLLMIEWDRRQSRGSSVHRFRFACLATSNLLEEPMGVVSAFESLTREADARPRVTRKVQAISIVPMRSEAFQSIRRNDVNQLRQLFSTGLATPFDYHEGGQSLLSVSRPPPPPFFFGPKDTGTLASRR